MPDRTRIRNNKVKRQPKQWPPFLTHPEDKIRYSAVIEIIF